MADSPAESSTGVRAPIRREELSSAELVRRLPGRNISKADLCIYRIGSDLIAVKDYAPRPWIVRQTLGRWLARRETRAYGHLRGIAGIPGCFGRVDAFAIALEFVEGSPLSALPRGSVRAAQLAPLSDIVAAAHARGVALGDIHHRDVLIRPDGAIALVDLATAWWLGPDPGRLRRWIFQRLCEADRIAWVRLSARAEGHDPEAAVEALGGDAARWHRRGRRVKRLWSRLARRRSA